VVALTGGIASGKTAVSDRFARLGVPVVDADVMAREVVQPGQPALARIAAEFGVQVLDDSGHLDRRRMREMIFVDPETRRRLEAIVHPAINRLTRENIAAVEADYCILVIPLLAVSGRYEWADRVLVVDVDEGTQVARVMARDGIDEARARAILAAQASRQERLALADDVIENSSSLEELDGKVAGLHEKYCKLAGEPAS